MSAVYMVPLVAVRALNHLVVSSCKSGFSASFLLPLKGKEVRSSLQLPWGAWMWLRIELCWYSKSTGSSPWHNVVAVAMANKPQSLPPSWIWVFMWWMICLQEISSSLLHKHISTTVGYSLVLTYLENAWYWSFSILEMLRWRKRLCNNTFFTHRSLSISSARTVCWWKHISRMFLQGETPDPSDNCSGNRYHQWNMFGGTHFSGKHISL